MLGRLSRHLRMLGFDTLYPGGHGELPGDDDLYDMVQKSRRVLLTRDKELGRRHGAFLVVSDELFSQLTELTTAFGQSFQRTLEAQSSRCTLCNGELKGFDISGPSKDIEGAHKVEGQAFVERASTSHNEASTIPVQVMLRHSRFWRCRDCQHLYWHGTHWQRTQEIRDELLRIIRSQG